MPEKALKKLAKRYHLSLEQLDELLQLLKAQDSPFYILRYRRDLAANLTTQDLDALREHYRESHNLEKEKSKILKKLQEQGTLTEELEQRMDSAETMRELLDYYVPYRPRKHSPSRQALSQGLEPLARSVVAQEEHIPLMSDAAAPFVDPEKGLETVGHVLNGVHHIICDWLAEEKAHRDRQRTLLRVHGNVVARGVGKAIPSRLRGEFKDYLHFEAKAKDIRPHQMLSLARGQRLRVLTYDIQPPLLAMCRAAAGHYMRGKAEEFDQIDAVFHDADPIPEGEALGELTGSEFLYFCVRQSLCDILAPILSKELERELSREAEELALKIVCRNLRSRLMARPLKDTRVLAVSPGYRTGCKLAALDETGGVLDSCIVYPHTPRLEKEEAKEKIVQLVQTHSLSVAAIADGTAFHETEALISEIIAETCSDLQYTVVGVTGIDTYVGGQLARAELPDLSADLQAAACVGRRLQDPLLELAKLSLRSLCTAQYAQDLNAAAFKRTLARVTEECVAEVGADVNTGPQMLLKYVPGLNAATATELVQYRAAKGPFRDRQAVRDVPKIDEDMCRRAVGFLKVTDSDNPLDVTRIHPDNYPVVMAVLEQLGMSLESLRTQEGRDEVKRRRGEINFADMEKRFSVHYLLIKDLLDELSDPWPDPRLKEKGPFLRQRQLTFEDLQPDQTLSGTVRKIVDFGVFVDVGLSEDGLVHISELSDEFVHTPYDVVSVGEQVNVRVIEVDPEKRRIALSMRAPGARKAPPKQKPTRRREGEYTRTERQPSRPAPAGVSGRPVHRPQSTLGPESRRVQKVAAFRPVDKAGARPEMKKAQPRQDRTESTQEEPAAEKAGGGLKDLLTKLEFAEIEKRGKASDDN